MLLERTEVALQEAVIVAVDAQGLCVRAGGEERRARSAVPPPYRPQAGDRVLLAVEEDRAYVIGVLEAHGALVFTVPGDLDLEAPQGRVRVRAGKGIALESPDVAIRTGRLQILAETVIEKCRTAYRWVRDLAQLQAGRSRTVVEGTSTQRAERTYIQSRRETKIDGEKIHLG